MHEDLPAPPRKTRTKMISWILAVVILAALAFVAPPIALGVLVLFSSILLSARCLVLAHLISSRWIRLDLLVWCLLAVVTCIALWNPSPSPRPLASKNACLSNMKQIAAAKESWIKHKSTHDVPTWSDLAAEEDPALRVIPECPRGGTYTIGKISEPPTCSIAEHNDSFKKPIALSRASAANTSR
jgi:hypothetical protein